MTPELTRPSDSDRYIGKVLARFAEYIHLGFVGRKYSPMGSQSAVGHSINLIGY